jgi:hypothetical protein
MTGPGNKRLLAALEANWQAEMEVTTPTRPLPRTKSIRNVGTLCEVWPLRKGIMPIYGLGASRNWAHQHRSTLAIRRVRPVRSQIEWVGQTWRCAGWRSMKPETSPSMESS